MSFIVKNLKTIKERLDKMSMDPAAKYYYLAGALDYVFEDGKGIFDLIPIAPKKEEMKPKLTPCVDTHTHPVFAPQISKTPFLNATLLKEEKPAKKERKYSVEECKVIILNTLPMCGKGTFMQVREMMKYNNMPDTTNIYQPMSIAVKQLADNHKIIKQRKIMKGYRGVQYEYALPSDMPTKIVLNGDLVEQQRRS